MLTSEEIKENGNESVILYLTDGNTEMGTKVETEDSLAQKNKAVEKARKENIRIFSLCLNVDGSVDSSEMKQIAESTEGYFTELRSDDMTEAFKMFYEMIYSTKSLDTPPKTVGSTGRIEENIDVPYAGVEELNIIIKSESKVSEIYLAGENGELYTPETHSECFMVSDNYVVVKIPAPTGGIKKLSLKGSPDTTVNISMLYNTSLSVQTSLKNEHVSYKPGDSVEIQADILTGTDKYADANLLKHYTIKGEVFDKEGNTEELTAVYQDGHFTSKYPVSSEGSFQAVVTVTGNVITAKSDIISFNVNNTPPELLMNSISETVYILPWKDTHKATQRPNTATIVIGCGGTGKDAVKQLKKSMYARVRADNPDADVPEYRHVKFISIDTDGGNLKQSDCLDRAEKAALHHDVNAVFESNITDLTETEFISIGCNNIKAKLDELSERRANGITTPGFEWIDSSKKDILSADAGAGGVRQIGRLLFVDNVNKIKDRIQNEKNSVLGNNTGNSRNGYGRKTITSDYGECEIAVPRDRNGEFEPKIIEKRQTRTDEIEQKILAMYAKGMSQRDIEDTLREIYGSDISQGLISRITDKILPEVNEWQNRPLDSIYPVIFFDGIVFNSRKNNRIISKCAYSVLGINMEGQKEILGTWIKRIIIYRFSWDTLTYPTHLVDILFICSHQSFSFCC